MACVLLPLAARADNGPVLPETPPGANLDWPSYNNTYDGQRFSRLKDVNPGNADRLAEACKVKVGATGTFEPGLVMTDGKIFGTTPHDTFALDARTCATVWKVTYTAQETEILPINRGVAVLDGRLFRGTTDGRLIALSAKDGGTLWTDVIGNPRLGEYVSAAPIAWNGVVYVGTAGGDFGTRGRMMAFDAATGREIWHFNTIPMGHEPGAESWKSPAVAKTGGGATWTTYTLDIASGEIFIPVGNPAPDFSPSYRPGENLYTDSVVVLDAHSGALKWWYQLAPHDGVDHDLGAAPVLYRDDRARDAVAFAGKDGYLQAVDRDSHKLMFRTPVTTIENEGAMPTPGGTRICPGGLGGTEWNGPAYDPHERLLIVGSVDWCSKYVSGSAVYTPGNFFYGGNMAQEGDSGTGWVTGVDAADGKARWRYHADAPVVAAVTPTAGGVTFTGDTAGNFLVFDTKTGALLKKLPTEGALAGGVITYALDGKQYVAFADGNVSRATFGVLGSPSVHILTLSADAKEATAAPGPGGSNVAHGHALFTQICAVCHGAGGSGIAGHTLGDIKSRRDFAATVDAIENPKPPMPKLYPEQLSADDVRDLAGYLQSGL